MWYFLSRSVKQASARVVRCDLNPPVTLWLNASAALHHCNRFFHSYSPQRSRQNVFLILSYFCIALLFPASRYQEHLCEPMQNVSYNILPEGAVVSFGSHTHAHPLTLCLWQMSWTLNQRRKVLDSEHWPCFMSIFCVHAVKSKLRHMFVA